MNNIEWIDKNGDFLEITEDLWILKADIIEEKSKYEKYDIYINWKSIWIPDDFIINFIKKLQRIYNIDEIKANWLINEDVKKYIIWEQNVDISYITNEDALILSYFKELSGNDFVDIYGYYALIYDVIIAQRDSSYINRNFENIGSAITAFVEVIKKYWNKSVTYLKFFFPREWNYNKDFDYWWWYTDWIPNLYLRWMVINFFDIFWNEPEISNLLNFLYEYPQTLSNLWWKEVKSIDLNIKDWFNFCYKWILEMVKSRSDIDFPHLWDNPTNDEKMKRKTEWEKIIHEYELILKEYINKDYKVDKDGNKHEKPKETTFWKIFFSTAIGDAILEEYNVSKKSLQNYSKQTIADYSFNENKYSQNENGDFIITEHWITEDWRKELWQQMIKDIEKYSKEHPDEDILVFIQHHWNPDWSSGNWWTKEDWVKLANISPRIKILSDRCYFWTAYENKEIYNQLSSVSWFSNESVTNANISSVIGKALEKWVWFHELEILSRLNYNLSTTSLSESMEYTNWNTWETEIWKIWLAQNDGWEINDFNELA